MTRLTSKKRSSVPGGIHCLLGSTGSDKSTLIKILADNTLLGGGSTPGCLWLSDREQIRRAKASYVAHSAMEPLS